MAITFVSASQTSNSSQNTLTPSEPASVAQNDIIIALAAINQTGGTWTDPADFTEIHQKDDNAYRCYVGYKIRGANSGSGYQFSSSSAAAQIAVSLVAFRGINTGTPFDVAFVAASHQNTYVNNVTGAAPAITTVTNGAEVVLLQHWNGAVSGFALVAPTNYTSRSQVLAASRTNFIVSRNIAVAGTETPGAWNTTGSATTQDSSNWTLALRPAVTARKGGFGLMGMGR